jgi:hypothetical protein
VVPRLEPVVESGVIMDVTNSGLVQLPHTINTLSRVI